MTRQIKAKAHTTIIVAGIIHGADGVKRRGALVSLSNVAAKALASLSLFWLSVMVMFLW
jgi:hypothetical protein